MIVVFQTSALTKLNAHVMYAQPGAEFRFEVEGGSGPIPGLGIPKKLLFLRRRRMVMNIQ